MREVVEVIPEKDFFVTIRFHDGSTGHIDMKPLMKREIFEALWDEDFFAQVAVDRKFKGIYWPGGREVCIDWIEAEMARQRPRVEYA